MTPRKFRIIHYNDVYNIAPSKSEPVGGAARFVTAVRKAEESAGEGVETFITFAGDAFSPAPLTPYTKGEEIPPVLNAIKTTVACVGNHELDNGIDVMKERVSETNFPWVLSNLIDSKTGKPLGDASRSFILKRGDVKIGFFGLASQDWIDALSIPNVKDLRFTDLIEASDQLATELRKEGCDVICAITHTMIPDDTRIAENAKDVDIILGGHDHVVWKKKINGRWAIKAGTDFKSYATVDFTLSENKKTVEFEEPVMYDVTGDIAPDPDMHDYVMNATAPLRDPALDKGLAICSTTLDGRFLSIRTQETGLGNLVCDAIADVTHVPNVLYNSGCFRADNLDPPSPWTARELEAVLPFHNAIYHVSLSADELMAMLENAVSQYPLLAGRFLQVSGLKYSFDPRRDANDRIEKESAKATDGNGNLVNILGYEGEFEVIINAFVLNGGDGYPPTAKEDIKHEYDRNGPQMVAAYLSSIETDLNNDGVEELGIVAPVQEGRITCVAPDPDTEALYPY